MSTVVIMVEKQTPCKSNDSKTSINGVLYNTEIPNITFVIKCLLHDYVIDAHVLFRDSTRTEKHIMSLAHSSISLFLGG